MTPEHNLDLPSVCNTCDGSGTVTITDVDVVDKGTKWQRSAEYEVQIECPTCNGKCYEQGRHLIEQANDALWLLSGLHREFPGLWDGEQDVNGADLVDWLTYQLAELDYLKEI